MVSQTVKTSTTPETFAAEIDGRVQSIAKAHTLLSQAEQGEMALRALITTELAPYDRQEGSLAIAGPEVALTPKAGLALAMAIHELASNARSMARSRRHLVTKSGGQLPAARRTTSWHFPGRRAAARRSRRRQGAGSERH
jgi:two-component sensor histidine kinase